MAASLRRLLVWCAMIVVLTSLQSCQLFNGDGALSDKSIKSGIRSSRLNSTGPRAAIGAREHPKILATYGGAYKHPKAEALLQSIVGNLVTNSDAPARNYKITILNSPAVNAFALPGGYIYVTRGLLALANDSAELAAVLSHEMSHITADHGITRSRRAGATGIADRVVSDVLTNPVAGKIAKASSKQQLALFSRNQELQADSLGIKLLGKSGYDPYAAVRFLQSMTRYATYRSGKEREGAEEDFLNSHPSTPRRIELARRHARFFGMPGSGNRYRKEYLAAIDQLMFGDSAAEGYVRGRQFSHKALGITFRVPAGFSIDNKAAAVLASGPSETAIRFDAVSQPNSNGLVAYLRSGWVNGLKRDSVKPGTINGLPSAHGVAETADWVFDITVIRQGVKVYRFIVAARTGSSSVSALAQTVTRSFRRLSNSEKAALRPLMIKIVAKRAGDSIGSLAARMSGVANRVSLFRVLNALPSGTRLKPRQKVKLVVQS